MVRVLVLEARRRREPRVRWAGDGLVWWGRRKTKTKTAVGARTGKGAGAARVIPAGGAQCQRGVGTVWVRGMCGDW